MGVSRVGGAGWVRVLQRLGTLLGCLPRKKYITKGGKGRKNLTKWRRGKKKVASGKKGKKGKGREHGERKDKL